MKWGLGLFLGLGLMAACDNASTGSKKDTAVVQPVTPSEDAAYGAEGMAIAKASFQALSGALMAQMKAGGPVAAVDFCNVHASSLVDSLMTAHHVSIRRTSTRFRNPANKPSELERDYLAQFDSIWKAGEEPRGLVVPADDGVHYFQPIFLSEACLKCHGSTTDMSPETHDLLSERYPNDRATGFLAGDLRGMWSIKFEPRSASTRENN